ncbi:hypothetical protein [Mycobacterium malmoense]|uniref:hypothetical protein n=1 Tax=Mycobacterium malmoense TaxID=1780 RepID=UPI0008F85CCD|nr:hypothetical protein [Mycobacterium malmoense]OIN79996.1 hypothetical protein BMG05_15065 [Mycobacterium malmoense]
MITYGLAEVAAQHLPPEIKDPVRWLSMRLNRGELRGVRIGRYWRMRQSDIDYMVSLYSNDEDVNGPGPGLPGRRSFAASLTDAGRRALNPRPGIAS